MSRTDAIIVPPFIDALTRHYFSRGSDPLIFSWANGTRLRATVFAIYETDNGLELNDKAYEEYVGCLIMIQEVIDLAASLNEVVLALRIEEVRPGKTVELTPHIVPQRIHYDDGETLWEAN